jgi:hypothetical protein
MSVAALPEASGMLSVAGWDHWEEPAKRVLATR